MLLALIGAALIGLTLGLLGSGGSILTVPVLVYLVGEPDKVAITESLAIVGLIAAVGAIPYGRRGEIDVRTALRFGLPGLVGAFAGATLARFVPGAAQLVLFAIVMLLAAVTMLRGRPEASADRPAQAPWLTAVQGLGVGVLTGLVGVGGGFLIVPALVLLVGLPMRQAVGTSLVVIAMNSLVGFVRYLDTLAATGGAVDGTLVATFAAIGIVGSLVGGRLGQRVPQATLRRVFAFFLIAMGAFILWQEAGALLG